MTSTHNTQRIEVIEETSGSPQRVFDLLADGPGWTAWAGFDEAVLARPGEPEPNGVGALRRIRKGRVRTVERVVAFEPHHRFAYELVSGLPVRDYRGEGTLDPTPSGGTRITWRSTFRPGFPLSGPLQRVALRRFLRRTARSLARAAQ
jgi:hypothetical protein